jgi:hypothetical protein
MASRRKELVREIRPYVKLYRDPSTGIAWVEDGTTGVGHSAHPNIHRTGSVAGMKNPRHVSGRGPAWGKHDRTVRSHGWIYNIDHSSVSGELDRIACQACQCGGNHGGCAEKSSARFGNMSMSRARRQTMLAEMSLNSMKARLQARELVSQARQELQQPSRRASRPRRAPTEPTEE